MDHPCEYCGSDEPCDCLERINCEYSGYPNHYSCGWCSQHSRPKFQCKQECWTRQDDIQTQ